MPHDFISQKLQDDLKPIIVASPEESILRWEFDRSRGTGTLSQGEKIFSMTGSVNGNANTGNNLVFSGNEGKSNWYPVWSREPDTFSLIKTTLY